MLYLSRLLAPLALALALVTGCAGPPVPAPIQGEPVCPDFEMGPTHVKMSGSLRYPVRLRLLEGKTVMMKLVLDGKRTADTPPSHSFVADDSTEYVVEWAQCLSERAPAPIVDAHQKPGHPPRVKEGGAYECGEATVYKTDKLVTKKHDPASHALTFEMPPKPECWVSDITQPTAVAADAGAPAADAGEGATAAASDGGATTADAGAPVDAGTPVDAGAAKAKDTEPKK